MPAKPKTKDSPPAAQMTPGGVPIHCRYDALIAAKELNANPLNYRRHPDSHVAKLTGVIRENGWRKPVVVSRLSGLIVTGHGATAAGISMDDSVPVEYQDFDSPAAEKQALIADNKASEGAKDDENQLAQLIKELAGVTPSALAMSQEEMERLTAMAAGASPPGTKPRTPPKAVISYNIIFDTLDQQARFYDALNRVKKTNPELQTLAARLDHLITSAPA